MKNIYIYALAGVLALSSCDEFLREEPEDFMSAESEDVDEALIEAEIQGAYKSTLWFKNGRQGFIGITGTDEARGKTVEVNYWAEQGAIEGASIDANKGAYSSAWMIIFAVIAAVMVLLGLYHIKMLPSTQVPATGKKSTSEIMQDLVNVIGNFFTKKHIVYYIFFIILYRLAEGFIMKVAPLFLRASREVGGLGLSLTEIGTLNGVFGSAAFVIGSLLGGIFVARYGLKKTLFTLCCVFNLPFLAYTFLAVVQPTSLYLIGTCITMEYFGYGFGFVGLTLFMMQQIAPGKHQMSHYAFASGIMNLGVMLPGMISGYFSDLLGYRSFFIYVLIATIPAFLMTYFIPFTYDDSKKKK